MNLPGPGSLVTLHEIPFNDGAFLNATWVIAPLIA
jgi:hypothetical protein